MCTYVSTIKQSTGKKILILMATTARTIQTAPPPTAEEFSVPATNLMLSVGRPPHHHPHDAAAADLSSSHNRKR